MSTYRKAEVKIVPANATRRNIVSVGNLTVPDRPGELFIDLLKTASFTGVADGETSKGEVRIRTLTPQEAVDRAATLVKLAFERIEAEGWWLQYPTYDEIEQTDTHAQAVGFGPRREKII